MKSRVATVLITLSTMVAASCGTGAGKGDGESRNAVIASDWTKELPQADLGQYKGFKRVVVASDGSVYAAMDTTTAYKGAVIGLTDIVLTKFDTAGTEIWSRRFGTPKDDTVDGLVIGEAGVVWVGGTTPDEPAVTPGDHDVWVRGFDPAGNEVASSTSRSAKNQTLVGIDWDDESSSLLVGVNDIAAGASVQGFTASTGWRQLMSLGAVTLRSMKSDDAGSVVVATSVFQLSRIEPLATAENVTSTVSRYTLAGALRWRTVMNIPTPSTLSDPLTAGLGDDIVRDLSIAPDGSVYVLGEVAPPVSTVFEMGFLVRINPVDGSIVWLRKLKPLDGDPGREMRNYFATVDVTDIGDVWVTGTSNKGFDVDYLSEYAGIFVFKFSASGGQTALFHRHSGVRPHKVFDADVAPDNGLVLATLIGSGPGSTGGTLLQRYLDRPAEPVVDGAAVVDQFGTPGPDRGQAVALAPNGGYYAAVELANDANPTAAITREMRLMARGTGADWETVVGPPCPGCAAPTAITDIVPSSDGSVVVLGNVPVNGADNDLFIARYEDGGSRAWVLIETVNGNQGAGRLSLDDAGNIIVTALSNTSVRTGDPTSSNLVALVYDWTGKRLHVNQWGDAPGGDVSRAIPGSDGTYVVASTSLVGDGSRGRVRIDRFTYEGIPVTRGSQDATEVYPGPVLLTRLNGGKYTVATTTPVVAGRLRPRPHIRVNVWSSDLSSHTGSTLAPVQQLHRDCISDLASLPDDQAVLVGTSPCTIVPADITRNSGFIMRLNSLGTVVDVRRSGVPLYDTYTAVAADSSGNYVVTGAMTTLVLDSAPGTGDVIVRYYAGPKKAVAPATTVAPATSLAPATTVAPVTTSQPESTATDPAVGGSTTNVSSPASTVAVSTGSTTVMTVPKQLDETATKLANESGEFSANVGGVTVTGRVETGGKVVVTRPESVPAAKPFVTSLTPGSRSVRVGWSAVPGAISYVVVASGGKLQSCRTDATECTVSGLVPGYPYQFVVSASADTTVKSDASLPVKPVFAMKRNATVNANRVLPVPTDRKAKVTWKAKGTCKVNSSGAITTTKKRGRCTVTRSTSRTKSSAATRLTFTVVVR